MGWRSVETRVLIVGAGLLAPGCAAAPRDAHRPTAAVSTRVTRADPLALAPSPGAATPRCTPETAWDGFTCAHAAATCGGWNGFSCEPSLETDLAPERQHPRIDAAARAICADDDADWDGYTGTVHEVIVSVESALQRTAAVEADYDSLTGPRITPRWAAERAARIGRLYDCIWSRLRDATPALFDPKQQVLINKLQTIVNQLNQARQPNNGNAMPAQIQSVADAVHEKWEETRAHYLAQLATKMMNAYVTAEVLARRHAVSGEAVARVRERLGVVAMIVGDSAMEDLVTAVVVQVGEEGTVQPGYLPGMFRARAAATP